MARKRELGSTSGSNHGERVCEELGPCYSESREDVAERRFLRSQYLAVKALISGIFFFFLLIKFVFLMVFGFFSNWVSLFGFFSKWV